MHLSKFFKIHPDVGEAMANGKPVVALESTIIAHGMPYPQNFQTAMQVESLVRKEGVVPATIALIDGCVKIGLDQREIDELAQSDKVFKASRRDLSYVIAKKYHGATTVAATMKLAKMAGIKVFVTGGIGGVHRDAETTFDISADLQELAHNDTVVVCAGAKSILDIPLTLEYLETHQIPIVGYQTNIFPAFFTRSSGIELTMSLDSPDEIAHMIDVSNRLKMANGIVVANPIPKQFEIDQNIIERAIQSALEDAKKLGITGKKITPFLLAEITRRSGGKSLESNIQLVFNNAQLGAQIAKCLVKMRSQ